MFRAIMCPSSGADDCVMLLPRVLTNPSMDALPANRTWQPSCSHGTYQHKAITSRSRQLLMMGTWLPETCWATIRRKIKIQKVASSWFFLSTLNYDARSTTHQIYITMYALLFPQLSMLRLRSCSTNTLYNSEEICNLEIYCLHLQGRRLTRLS